MSVFTACLIAFATCVILLSLMAVVMSILTRIFPAPLKVAYFDIGSRLRCGCGIGHRSGRRPGLPGRPCVKDPGAQKVMSVIVPSTASKGGIRLLPRRVNRI